MNTEVEYNVVLIKTPLGHEHAYDWGLNCKVLGFNEWETRKISYDVDRATLVDGYTYRQALDDFWEGYVNGDVNTRLQTSTSCVQTHTLTRKRHMKHAIVTSNIHPAYLSLYVTHKRTAKYILVDLSNGHAGKGYYIWGFETRKACEQHAQAQKRLQHAAKLSRPLKLATYEERNLRGPAHVLAPFNSWVASLVDKECIELRVGKWPVLQIPLDYSGGHGIAFERAADFYKVLVKSDLVR